MPATPQIIITLTPDHSGLQAELPGANGMRRVVALERQIPATLLRMLLGLLADKTEIGEDGAPTSRQVRHWERHGLFPDDKCPFCLSEKKISAPKRQKQTRPAIPVADGSVKVRRLPAKGKGAKASRLKVRQTLEELGL